LRNENLGFRLVVNNPLARSDGQQLADKKPILTAVQVEVYSLLSETFKPTATPEFWLSTKTLKRIATNGL
jgi:hypothetical protein